MLVEAPVFVLHGNNIIVHPSRAIEHDGRVIWKWLISRNYETPELSTAMPTTIETPCAYIGGVANFGHAIFEDLTRVAMLDMNGLGHLPVVVTPGARVIDFLKLLGREYIEAQPPVLLVDGAIPCCPLGRDEASNPYANPEAMQWVRDAFPPSTPTKRRMYFPRQASHRNITNDAELTELLISRGFEAIDLAALPLIEQIALVSSAEIIVMPLGAASAISAWARGGFIELSPPDIDGIFGSRIWCATFGLPYERINGIPEKQKRDSNYTISLDVMGKVLDFWERT